MIRYENVFKVEYTNTQIVVYYAQGGKTIITRNNRKEIETKLEEMTQESGVFRFQAVFINE